MKQEDIDRAIEWFEQYKKFWKKASPTTHDAIIDTAIQALRQYKPSEGCEWCREYTGGLMKLDRLRLYTSTPDGYDSEVFQTMSFCPSCGRALKDGE